MSFSGDAGDFLTNTHNRRRFSTYDVDNDVSPLNCAVVHQGAWWYDGSVRFGCCASNLNGRYESSVADVSWHRMFWDASYPDDLKATKMMLRQTP